MLDYFGLAPWLFLATLAGVLVAAACVRGPPRG